MSSCCFTASIINPELRILILVMGEFNLLNSPVSFIHRDSTQELWKIGCPSVFRQQLFRSNRVQQHLTHTTHRRTD